MFGIENLLVEILGDNALLIMLAGFFLLIILNLFVKLYIEFKKKDLRWEDLPEFVKPIVLYTIFLVGLDILVVTGKGIPAVHEIFQGLQILGYVAVMAKYFKRFYCNLKELGLPTDEKIDSGFEDKLDGITQDAKKDIGKIVEEYLEQRDKEKEKEGAK